MTHYVVCSGLFKEGEPLLSSDLMKIVASYGATLRGKSDTAVLVEMSNEEACRLRLDRPGLLVDESSAA